MEEVFPASDFMPGLARTMVLEPFRVRLQHSAGAGFVRAKAIGEGHTPWYVRADRLCPDGKMPGPPAAPLRQGEAISASGDFKVLQICQANLREGWLKRAG
ncbi:hypothetical protein A6U98_29595 [Rhizobium sp. WYCCWR10014]|nr:hypothetical protein A6U98_29595 [Rhizobium sp. WYCCWR10014]